MKASLPGIIKIGFVNPLLLTKDVTARAMAGVPVAVFTDVEKIKITDTAECEVETDYDNNSQVDKVKLTFKTLDELPRQPLAFVIGNADGERFLIGAREKPYPVVKVSDGSGTPGGESSVKTCTVTWTAKKGLVKCAIP